MCPRPWLCTNQNDRCSFGSDFPPPRKHRHTHTHTEREKNIRVPVYHGTSVTDFMRSLYTRPQPRRSTDSVAFPSTEEPVKLGTSNAFTSFFVNALKSRSNQPPKNIKKSSSKGGQKNKLGEFLSGAFQAKNQKKEEEEQKKTKGRGAGVAHGGLTATRAALFSKKRKEKEKIITTSTITSSTAACCRS